MVTRRWILELRLDGLNDSFGAILCKSVHPIHTVRICSSPPVPRDPDRTPSSSSPHSFPARYTHQSQRSISHRAQPSDRLAPRSTNGGSSAWASTMLWFASSSGLLGCGKVLSHTSQENQITEQVSLTSVGPGAPNFRLICRRAQQRLVGIR